MPHLPDDDAFWALLLGLREQGYNLDTGQMASAMVLLARAQAAADGDAARARFWSRLVPVLATSAETAQSLRQHFDLFIVNGSNEHTPTMQRESLPARDSKVGIAVGPIVIGIGVAALILLSIMLMNQKSDAPIVNSNLDPVTATEPAPTTPETTVDIARDDLRYGLRTIPTPASLLANLPQLQAGLMVAPLLGFAAWVWVSWQRRRVRLRACSGVAGQMDGKARYLPGLDVKGSPLFISSQIRQTAHELRAQRRLQSRRLDVARTVVATARRSGALLPVSVFRCVTPELLILIERKSVGDHLAALFRLAALQLRSEGLEVQLYYYSRDPRLLVSHNWQNSPGEMVEVEQLARYAAHQRLIIIGSTIALLDLGHGGLAPWLSYFDCWTDRALLDPSGRTHRISAERRLIAAGWFLGTAEETHIGQLRHWLAKEEAAAAA